MRKCEKIKIYTKSKIKYNQVYFGSLICKIKIN
jgi:hypothetical protein